VPSRLLLPRKLVQLLRVPHRQILSCHKFSLHQLPLWAVPERCFSVKLQGVSCGTCHCRRLQAEDLLAPTCTQLILCLRCKVFSRYNVRTVLCTQKIFTFNRAWLYLLRRATTARLPPRRTTRAQPATTAPQARAVTTRAQQENMARPQVSASIASAPSFAPALAWLAFQRHHYTGWDRGVIFTYCNHKNAFSLFPRPSFQIVHLARAAPVASTRIRPRRRVARRVLRCVHRVIFTLEWPLSCHS